MASTIRGEIVKEYLSRFPDIASKSLAIKIYKENKTVFKDEESVRSIIRYFRHTNGKKIVANSEFVTEKSSPIKFAEKLRSYYQEPKDYVFDLERCNNMLVISDLHIPYQFNDGVDVAINYGLSEDVDSILINGDLLDMHFHSKHEKDPRKRNTKEEFDVARQFLSDLRDAFPTQKIIFLKGNHDKRWETWLYAKAPEIFDDTDFLLEKRLKCDELDIEVLNDDILLKFGKLSITHGHLLIKGVFAPVNAARGAFLRAKSNVLISHVHSTSEHIENRLDSRHPYGAWSIGCLTELAPNYDPMNTKHNHGFGRVEIIGDDGSFIVHNKKIVNGKAI
jgi:predicted phosphodiesterase